MSQKNIKIIGIDLGTKFMFCVMEGKVANLSQMQRCTYNPSVVAFTDSDTLVGQVAKRQATNPAGTVYSAKQFIGVSLVN